MVTRTEFKDLSKQYDELLYDTRTLVNYLLRIRRKCENESLWLMASCDPHKPLETEQQQGPMITKLFILAQEIKRKIK